MVKYLFQDRVDEFNSARVLVGCKPIIILKLLLLFTSFFYVESTSKTI